MKKNYTKPEIQVSRYEIEDVTMSVVGTTSTLFEQGGTGANSVDTVKVVSYTEIFGA